MPITDLISPEEYAETAKGVGDKFRLGAQQAIRRYCGWHVAPVITSELFRDGNGRSMLLLPTLRIEAVMSVIESGRILTENRDFEWSEDGVLHRFGRWSRRMRAIKATITHGYDSADELATLVVTIAERAKASPAGIVSETAGAVNIRFSTFGSGAAGGVALMEHEYALLDQYRLPPGRR